MELQKTLQTLCALPAISGFEQQAATELSGLLKPYCTSVSIDKMGNVHGFVGCGRKNAPTVLLDAHLDQIGFVVTEVLEGGFLRFAPVGGIDPRMLLSGEVMVYHGDAAYPAIVACLPPHLLSAADRDKSVPIDQMYLDTGLVDARGKIEIGDMVRYAQPQLSLLGDVVTGPCMDDRAGIAAILYALSELKKAKKKLRVNLAVLFSAQEEVTGLGAQTGGFAVQPDLAIAVDVTHGKTPDGPALGTFALGSGAAIGLGPNFDRPLANRLIRTAKAHDIAYTLEVMEGHSGTNAWTLQIVAAGIKTALLSIPLRYMHTQVETLRLCDIEAVGKLLSAFLREFGGEVSE